MKVRLVASGVEKEIPWPWAAMPREGEGVIVAPNVTLEVRSVDWDLAGPIGAPIIVLLEAIPTHIEKGLVKRGWVRR